MLAYIVRRVFLGVIMLLAMSLITFVMFFASGLHPERYACGKNCTPQLQEQTKKALGYDKPVMTQWTDFLQGIVKGRTFPEDPALVKAAPQLASECPPGCLGYSVTNVKTVNAMIADAFPISLSLALMAFVLWIGGGVLFGVLAALKKGTIIDRGVVGIALIFFAFPTFFVGLMLYRFVAIKWQLFPLPEYINLTDNPVKWFVGLILPGLTLALFYMAGYIRMTRAFVLESFGEDYVRTARAKGLPERKVVFKHALRAALTPLVTMAGLDFAGLMGGAIITESVFNYDGLGKLAVNANLSYDLPTLVGLVVLLAAFVILANIIVDILYAVIDPRVRLG